MVLHFSNGETIETTAEHPFFVKDKGWVPAGQLAIGNAIVTRAGPSVNIRKIIRHPAGKTVYNFEVEDTHTYFVGTTRGGLWVHNKSCLDLAQEVVDELGDGAEIWKILPDPPFYKTNPLRPPDGYIPGIIDPTESGNWYEHYVVFYKGQIHDRTNKYGPLPIDDYKKLYGQIIEIFPYRPYTTP